MRSRIRNTGQLSVKKKKPTVRFVRSSFDKLKRSRIMQKNLDVDVSGSATLRVLDE